jgi:hypothetical protein
MDVDGEFSIPKKTYPEYKIGDIITKHSYENQYKCIEIKVEDEKITYFFKQGKRLYTFDW